MPSFSKPQTLPMNWLMLYLSFLSLFNLTISKTHFIKM